MNTAWKPIAGQVALIELDGEPNCLTGVVLQTEGGPVVIDLGASPQAPADGSHVVASFFAPDALYRVSATCTPHEGQGGTIDLSVLNIERVQRRTAPRAHAAVPVVLSDLDDPGDRTSVTGESIDVGPGGCRVRTQKRFPAGCDPTVTIHLPSGVDVVALGAVLQAHRTDEWEYRIVFLSIDDEDRDRLSHFAESQLP